MLSTDAKLTKYDNYTAQSTLLIWSSGLRHYVVWEVNRNTAEEYNASIFMGLGGST